MNPEILNSAGLALDIAGVVPLFVFGLPSDVVRPDEPDVLHLDTRQHPDEHLARERRWGQHRFWSRAGLGLLVSGFLLQIASNHIGG